MKPKHVAKQIPPKSINPVQYDADYYCPHCKCVVGGLAVTPSLHHSKAAGGCGRRVYDGASPDKLRIQPRKRPVPKAPTNVVVTIGRYNYPATAVELCGNRLLVTVVGIPALVISMLAEPTDKVSS